MSRTQNDEFVFRFGSQQRTFRFTPGSLYRIAPMNPLKKKGRGRICEVLEHPLSGNGYVKVRYQDTGRYGRVDAADLVPV